MCCDEFPSREEDTVGQCPTCGGDVDKDGDTTEAGCNYSPCCKTCGYAPCGYSC